MSALVVTHLAAMEHGLLRVVSSLRWSREGAGLCIEMYGRSPRNAWFEAVRVDGAVGDVHFHAFSEDGVVAESVIATASRREDVADAVMEFVRAGARPLLNDLGFASAAVEDAAWGDVLIFLRSGVIAAFLDQANLRADS